MNWRLAISIVHLSRPLGLRQLQRKIEMVMPDMG